MKRNIISQLSLLLALPLLVISCYTTNKMAVNEPKSKPDVVILSVNDMHASIDNFPRFAFMVDSLRRIYPDLILVSAGDNQTGNPINDQYLPKGLPIIELMNDLHFDLSAIGNHEFDTQQKGLQLLVERADFDFLGANICFSKDFGIDIKPFKIINLPNKIKVGFVSVVDINELGIPDTHPENVKGISFKDPYETAKEYLYLRDSVDVLAYLTHIGFEKDIRLAEMFPPGGMVDLIIGGHSHTKVDKEQIHNGILITQASSKLRYATLIKLNLEKGKVISRSMDLLEINTNGQEQPDIKAMLSVYNDNPRMRKKLAVAEDDFTSYEQMGYLMTDALRFSSKSDIALINPGGIRSDRLNKGPISVLDVYNMDPFGNKIVMVNLTGHELKDMHLKAFVIDTKQPISPSGIKSVYYLDKDGNLRDIEFFTSDGKPLDMDKSYKVAMNSFMASIYNYEHKDLGISLHRTTAEGMIDYLQSLKHIPTYRNEKRLEIRVSD